MPLWIPITIGAAFAQNLRFMLQKHLKATRLSTGGATFARFLFAAPLAAALVAGLVLTGLKPLPGLTAGFVANAAIGGLAQIVATFLVVALFATRNFAVGIALKKTETLQTALIAFLVLGDRLPAAAIAAILIGVVGVVLLSDPPRAADRTGWRARLFNRASGYGLAAGALFGVSATGYRGAALALEGGDFVIRASLTLAVVTAFQTVAMGLWLAWRERGQIAAVLRAWRATALAGLFGVTGSFLWFMAFTLERAAMVKALGQVELIFTFLAGRLVFGERSGWRERLGAALVVASVVIVVISE